MVKKVVKKVVKKKVVIPGGKIISKKGNKKLTVKQVLKKNLEGLELEQIIKLTGLTKSKVEKELAKLEKAGDLEDESAEEIDNNEVNDDSVDEDMEEGKDEEADEEEEEPEEEVSVDKKNKKPKSKEDKKKAEDFQKELDRRLASFNNGKSVDVEEDEEVVVEKPEEEVEEDEESDKQDVEEDEEEVVEKPEEKILEKKVKIPKKELEKIMKEEMKLNKKFQKKIPKEEAIVRGEEGGGEESEQDEEKGKSEVNEEEKIVEEPKISSDKFDVASIAREIKGELIHKQRGPVVEVLGDKNLKTKKGGVENYIFTGVPGFDELLDSGIPQGSSIIVAGGAGSGKTILCLQTLVNKAMAGEKCLYMTFEEREDRLIRHMEDFGWPANDLVKKGNLKIMRMNPFDITRNVDALLAKQKGELLIDIDPVIIPAGFKPDFVAIDSLTAIASAFSSKEESYRIYIEQLFRFLEKIGSTNLLITETEQIPKIFSQTGVEEFLADGVIVLYNLKHGNVRENALEILKLRGAGHQKKIVAYQITGEGIIVYPEQEVFSEVNGL